MRLKIIAGNLVILLIVGLVSFFVVRAQIEQGLAQQVDSQIGNDAKLFARSFRLSGRQFLDYVRDRAQNHPNVRHVFGGLDQQTRRQRAHEAANDVAQWFQNPARGREGAPDVVAITDATGKVLARNADPNRMYNTQLTQELPALRTVLQNGEARHDVWNKTDENKVLQTGIAPVSNEAGAVIGALVVAYDLSNGLAASEGSILGREVAFVVDGKVYSSSLAGEGAAEMEGLKAELFGPLQQTTQAALAGQPSNAWRSEFGGSDWVGVTAPLPLSPSTDVAYVVLANRSDAVGLAGSTDLILILTIVGSLFVIVYGFIIGTSFLKPLEEIEEGVLAVINGRSDLRLDIESNEFGGLAYRINQLINVFTGVSEEDEEGRSMPSRPPGASAAWGQDSAFAESQAVASPASTGGGAAPAGGGGNEPVDDPAVAQRLAAEPEADYLARVYQEYVAAKTAVGENVSNIPQERFAQRLKGNADALANKHGVRMVRFAVETRGSQVLLRPVLIR